MDFCPLLTTNPWAYWVIAVILLAGVFVAFRAIKFLITPYEKLDEEDKKGIQYLPFLISGGLIGGILFPIVLGGIAIDCLIK